MPRNALDVTCEKTILKNKHFAKKTIKWGNCGNNYDEEGPIFEESKLERGDTRIMNASDVMLNQEILEILWERLKIY